MREKIKRAKFQSESVSEVSDNGGCGGGLGFLNINSFFSTNETHCFISFM